MIWLLRFTWAGRTWYLSSGEAVPEEDGIGIAHWPTLEIGGFAEGVEIGGGVSGPCTADVSFTLDLDGWEYIRDGHRLDMVWGELSLWEPGTSYAERVVLVKGRMISDSIPRDGEPFEVTITQPVIDTATPWPPADDLINATAWPDAPSSSDAVNVIGLAYPWPIGFLGKWEAGSGETYLTSTTPVIVVDNTPGSEVGCIAGGPVAATVVSVWNSTQKDSADFDVTTTTDGEGNPRATIDLSTAPVGWTVDGSEPMYVNDWKKGGLLNANYGAPGQTAAGLADAIVFLLQRRYDALGPEAIDLGAWSAMAPFLNGWIVGFQNSSGDPMETITSRLLPLCPALWIVGGPSGFRPVFFADTPITECRKLVQGRDVFTSEEGPGFTSLLPVNQIEVSFAPSTVLGTTRGTVTIGPKRDPRAAASVTRHGGRIETIDASATYDRGTAAAAASETIRLRWTRPMYLVYDAPPEVALSLVLGQRVRLMDEDLGLNDRLLWLMARETDDGALWQLTLCAAW